MKTPRLEFFFFLNIHFYMVGTQDLVTCGEEEDGCKNACKKRIKIKTNLKEVGGKKPAFEFLYSEDKLKK